MKIFVEVTTPGNCKTYELKLDDKLAVGAAKGKIIEQITTYEDGCIGFDKDAALFSPDKRTRLPDHCNLRKAGVRSGQELLLL